MTNIGLIDPCLVAIEGPAPCDACRNAPRCAVQLEACPAFALYAKGASEARWRSAPRLPSREQFDMIFPEERPAKAQMPKRPRLLTVEERRQRNTTRKQRWRQDQRQARDAAA
jgi:hypothetical protein